MTEILSIFIDHREPVAEMRFHIEKHGNVRIEGTTLKTGDILIDDALVVERKTLTDFAASVVSGRLFSQIGRLASSPQQPVLILEGVGDPAFLSGVSRNALQGALITTTLFYGIPVLRAKDIEETCDLAVFCGRQRQRIASGGLQRAGTRPKGRRTRQLHILQGIPGIGKKRAESLLSHFGSIAAVCTASIKELERCPGIRESTAKVINEILR
jgi:ERCC4-type nuclease